MQLSSLSLSLTNVRRGSGVAPSAAVLQEYTPVIPIASNGTTTAIFTLDQATTAGSTLVLQARCFGAVYSVSDNLGGSTAGGQWIVAAQGTADGPPVFCWVYRGCPAGITTITITRGDGNFVIDQRVYFQEVSGVSLVAPIVTYLQASLLNQVATSFATPGAGFFAVHIHLSPSRDPEALNIGSVLRRLDFQDTAGTIPYADAVSEHSVHGLPTGPATFGSTWGVDLSTAWWTGIFIPIA